ncbi:MAG: TRAP transporter substrate-binding protein DctP [Desulfitobacterium sp.]
MKKVLKKVLGITVIAALVLTGCAKVQTAPASGSASSGTQDTPQFTWKMQVIHTTGQSDFEQHKQTAEDIYKMSNGRLKIEVVPNGTFASSMEAFQACGDGVFQMHSSWPIYAKGIEYALLPLSTGSMTMDAMDKWTWMYEHGGWDLSQKAFDKLNLQLVGLEIWGSEVMMSKNPYKSLSDMEGTKMRTSDPRMIAKYGVAGISMPLEEVFTAMSQGAVESAEFGHLKYDESLGLVDISDYAIYPDFWNVHFVTTVVVNKDAWNTLPPDLQLIVENAFKARELQHWTKSQYESAQTMKKLQESGELEFIRMNEDDFIKAREEMVKIEQEDAAKYGGLTAEVYDSINNFQEMWYPYKDMSAWWGRGLTVEQQLGYPLKK